MRLESPDALFVADHRIQLPVPAPLYLLSCLRLPLETAYPMAEGGVVANQAHAFQRNTIVYPDGSRFEAEVSGSPALGLPNIYDLRRRRAPVDVGLSASVGDGFAAARLRGEENADPMRPGKDGSGPEFAANNAGGIAGGISTGQPVVVRVAFKPTSSILIPQDTVTREGEATKLATKGRHDPCVGIRGTPVVAAMMALVLADHKLLHRGQCG